MNMTETIVELTGVAKGFRGAPLLRDVTMTLVAGHSYGLVGTNGSGKSVLLRLIAGIMAPDAGTVDINPRFLDARRVFPDRFGVFIDGPTFLGALTGLQNLRELARIRNRDSEAETRALLERLGLNPDNTTPARRYSLGMKQKLGLCQALMEDPEVVLLDEPFNALDKPSIGALDDVIDDMRKAGKTIVMTSHHPDHLLRHTASRIEIDGGTARITHSG